LPSTVGTSTDQWATCYGTNRKTFYANGLFWVFYSDGTNMVYRTSSDGVNWSSATTVRACAGGYMFAIWFDGTYVHYAYANYGTGQTQYYRRGFISGSSITWQAEQTVGTVTNCEHHTICTDSGGYPWIIYRCSAGIQVTKSSTNDGTWSTAYGFPWTLTSYTSSAATLTPLTAGKMYATYVTAAGSVIKGKLWSGSSWGDEESISSVATPNIESYYGWCTTVAEGDDIHLVYTKVTSYDLVYIKRTYGTGWGSEVTVQSATTSTTLPVLAKQTNNDLICFWAGSPTADHIYYKKRVSGTWDTNPTDWIDESTDHLKANSKLTCYYTEYSYIGLAYLTKTASPYNVRFAFLSLGVAVSVSDSAVGGESVTRPERQVSLSDQATGQEAFSRPERTMTLTEPASGLETILKMRDVAAILDSASGIETVLKARNLVVLDSAVGVETVIKEIVGEILKLVTDSATGSEIVQRLERSMIISDFGSGVEQILKTRSLSVTDLASGLETILKTRIVPTITDAAVGSEYILKERRLLILDAGLGAEQVFRSERYISISDLAQGIEEILKTRDVAAIIDTATGQELVIAVKPGVKPTKLFLIIGNLALQLTKD